MKKILFFDYWLKGLHNITPLYDSLSPSFECCLLHASSLQGIKELKHKKIGSLDCYDLSYFEGVSIRKALEAIRPDVIVVFNTTYILDRAIFLEAKKLGIITIFFQHGSRRNITKENFNKYQARSFSDFFNGRKFLKSVRYIREYLRAKPIAIPSMLITFHVIFEFLLRPKKAKLFPCNSGECMADYCCVYSEDEKAYYKTLGYMDDQIKVTGNPKLKLSTPFVHDNPYVLFIDEGLPEAGNLYGVDNTKRSRVLKNIAKSLNNINYDLLVKPHPLADKRNFDQGLYFFVEHEIGSLIAGSEACVCNVSTVGDNVIMENKLIISLSDSDFFFVPKPYLDSGLAHSINSSEINNIFEKNVTSLEQNENSKIIPFCRDTFIGLFCER